MDVILVLKIVVLAYILVSPFVDHSVISFVNATPVKVLLLIAIILVSFIDLHLAMLFMIAFLILLINLYKKDLQNLKNTIPRKHNMMPNTHQNVKEHMVRGQSIMPIPSENEHIEKFSDQHVRQTIAEFPAPYCPGKDYGHNSISDQLYLMKIDDRVKPFEEYVRRLSPEESIKLIQTNIV